MGILVAAEDANTATKGKLASLGGRLQDHERDINGEGNKLCDVVADVLRLSAACHEAREAFSSRAAAVVSRAAEAARAELPDSQGGAVEENTPVICFHIAPLMNADKAIGLRALAALAHLSSKTSATDEDLRQPAKAVRILLLPVLQAISRKGRRGHSHENRALRRQRLLAHHNSKTQECPSHKYFVRPISCRQSRVRRFAWAPSPCIVPGNGCRSIGQTAGAGRSAFGSADMRFAVLQRMCTRSSLDVCLLRPLWPYLERCSATDSVHTWPARA